MDRDEYADDGDDEENDTQEYEASFESNIQQI